VLTVLLTYLPAGSQAMLNSTGAIALFPFILVLCWFRPAGPFGRHKPVPGCPTDWLGMLMACTITFDLYHYFGPFSGPGDLFGVFLTLDVSRVKQSLSRSWQITDNSAADFWCLDHLDDNLRTVPFIPPHVVFGTIPG